MAEIGQPLGQQPLVIVGGWFSFAAGFSDISNFNHAFRREFGVSPREYRLRSSMDADDSH